MYEALTVLGADSSGTALLLDPSFGVYLTKVKQPLRVFQGIDPLQQTRKNKCFLHKQEDCHRQKLSYFSELARNEQWINY